MKRRKINSKSEFKKGTLRELVIFFGIIGSFIGIIYLIVYLAGEIDLTSLDLIVIIFCILILLPLVALFFWRMKLISIRRSQRRLRLVLAERSKDMETEEEKIIRQIIRPQVMNLGVKKIQTDNSFPPKISFNIPKGNQLDLFVKMSVRVPNSETIQVETFLKEQLPLSYSIKEKPLSEDELENSTRSPEQHYFCNSNHQHFCDSLIYSEELTNKLSDLKGVIEQVAMLGKFLTAKLKSADRLTDFLNFISDLHDAILVQDFRDVSVEQLLCYQCEDPFNLEEETCDKCSAARPVCNVCLLVLKPSEKKDVIKTPCCETYSHKKHIISWLESNPMCPNCKKDLYLWLRNLKQKDQVKIV